MLNSVTNQSLHFPPTHLYLAKKVVSNLLSKLSKDLFYPLISSSFPWAASAPHGAPSLSKDIPYCEKVRDSDWGWLCPSNTFCCDGFRWDHWSWTIHSAQISPACSLQPSSFHLLGFPVCAFWLMFSIAGLLATGPVTWATLTMNNITWSLNLKVFPPAVLVKKSQCTEYSLTAHSERGKDQVTCWLLRFSFVRINDLINLMHCNLDMVNLWPARIMRAAKCLVNYFGDAWNYTGLTWLQNCTLWPSFRAYKIKHSCEDSFHRAHNTHCF